MKISRRRAIEIIRTQTANPQTTILDPYDGDISKKWSREGIESLTNQELERVLLVVYAQKHEVIE